MANYISAVVFLLAWGELDFGRAAVLSRKCEVRKPAPIFCRGRNAELNGRSVPIFRLPPSSAEADYVGWRPIYFVNRFARVRLQHQAVQSPGGEGVG